MRSLLLASLFATACTQAAAPVDLDPDEAGDLDDKADGVSGIPDVRCADDPATDPAEGFRHTSSKITALLGNPRHRGIDLIATASESQQVLEGDMSYGTLDKALEDEDVDVFACRARQWRHVGTARTDDEGHFRIVLEDQERLPLGIREVLVSARGDRSSVRFLSLVAHDGAPLAVSDVDGTLTSSENAFGATIILGIDVDIHAGAADAFQTVAHLGYQPVYVTARSRAWTETTRRWLADRGMPRGPLRLAPHTILPGGATVDYKAGTLAALDGFELAIGNGNRASDIEAYRRAGVPDAGISIKLPEFEGEVADDLATSDVFGFEDYATLQARFATLPAR